MPIKEVAEIVNLPLKKVKEIKALLQRVYKMRGEKRKGFPPSEKPINLI